MTATPVDGGSANLLPGQPLPPLPNRASLTQAALLSLVALPGALGGGCWRVDAGAFSMVDCGSVFGHPFGTDAGNALTVRAQNWLLSVQQLLVTPACAETLAAFVQCDPLAGVVSWLGRLQELQGMSFGAVYLYLILDIFRHVKQSLVSLP